MCTCIPKKLNGIPHRQEEFLHRMEEAGENADELDTELSSMSRILCCPCRWRRLLFLLCLFLLLIGCIAVYIILAVCSSMTSMLHRHAHLKHDDIIAKHTVKGKFTAPGAESSVSLAPHPNSPFWREGLDVNRTGLWNRLQYKLDSRNSQVLRSDLIRSAASHRPISDVDGEGACVFSLSSVRKALPDFDGLPTHIQEFILKILCRNFPLLTDQPRLCEEGGSESTNGSEGGPFLLLAIKSQDEHYEQRQAIRETWGRRGQVRGWMGAGGQVRRVFLLGRGEAHPNPTQEELLAAESRRYGDLLRWGFKDSFFNLTLKDVLFWRWLSQRCPHVRFIFKGDDDIYVRTPALLDYLHQHLEEDQQRVAAGNASELHNLVVGDVIPLARPIRFKDIKYFIPESLYTGTYPTYPGGGGVVYSGALALRLHQVSQRVRLFPIDDVYVGMCLERLGVVPKHEPAFLTFDFPPGEEDQPCSYFSILLVHKRYPQVVRKLWEEDRHPPPQCRDTPLRVEPTPPPAKPKGKGKKTEPPPKAKPKQTKTAEIDITNWL